MFLESLSKTEKKFIIISVLFLLFFTDFLHYKYWDPTLAGRCRHIIFAFILFLSIKESPNYIDSSFRKLIKTMIVVSYLNLFSYLFIHGEGITNNEIATLESSFIFLFYFLFGVYQINERCIVASLTIFGLFVFIVQVVQQVFPENAVFGVLNEDKEGANVFEIAEIRNGLYRFRLEVFFVSLFCLYYYWQKILEKLGVREMVLFLCFFCSVYLYLTRQIIFATIICLLSSFFFKSNGYTKKYFPVILFCLFIFFAFFSDVLFGELIEKTTDDVSDDNIRNLCFMHYWNYITSDIISLIIGNGNLSIQNYWQEVFCFFRTDIGIIGEWFIYGLIWIFLYFYTVYLVLFKYSIQLPLYIKLYVLGTFLNSIMIFPYRSAYEFIVWVGILYCSSLYIENKKYLLS